ncbi:MAG: HRDC domain-containing protein [Pirellulaceae bacterium]
MNHQTITNFDDLNSFCRRLKKQPLIAFDTEFVSEDRYRPELCLLQVAAGEELAIVDPLAIGTTQPFWDLISKPGRTVVVHAGREEMRFCWRFTGKPIAGCFDVQLAAGFVGMEYPASLGTLVKTICGKTLGKGETRTDWRRRPLTAGQIEYALQDVVDLVTLHDVIGKMVDELNRRGWLEEEVAVLQSTIAENEQNESWHRVSGSSNLPPRQMAIVRELWRWREARAKKTDQPPRRILRDDLLVELAKRGSRDAKRINSIRGMERRNLQAHYEAISEAIGIALDLDESELPVKPRGTRRAKVPMLSQFLSTAIACVSRTHKMAPAIVGNADDVRDLLTYEMGDRSQSAKPALLQGWRGDVVGKSFRDVLDGKLAIRVANRKAEQPLEFIEVDD